MEKRAQIPADGATFDLVVIGAGINGTGIARDAARRGLRVLLMDKGDLCAGTSAWSSRLIHGGLRYLEHGEFDLVRESLHERERLFANAPHLVRPLQFFIPIYRGNQRPRWMVKVGMVGYDLLSRGRSVQGHTMLTRRQTLARVPALNGERLRGAATYYDGQVELAERLCVENALDARAHGATVLTYAHCERIAIEEGTVRGVEFTDGLSGARRSVRAPAVVNAAGPWVDEVLGHATPAAGRLIGGTRGTHLVVERLPGAPSEQALYLEAAGDGRPIFVLPWLGRWLIGTTDVRYEGRIDDARPTEEEVAYLLGAVNGILPEAGLSRADVLYAYSGVRPLPFVEEGSEAGITRRHALRDHAPQARGLLSVVGGKLTTYRALAQEVVDVVSTHLGRETVCTTDRAPLPGAETGDFSAFCTAFKRESGLPPDHAKRLLRIYGTRSAAIVDRMRRDAHLGDVFAPREGALRAELALAFEEEMAETLIDALMRRTLVGLGPDLGLEVLADAADWARRYLGWDAGRVEAEQEAYRAYARRFMLLEAEA